METFPFRICAASPREMILDAALRVVMADTLPIEAALLSLGALAELTLCRGIRPFLVGAGSAGAVIAARLTELPDRHVRHDDDSHRHRHRPADQLSPHAGAVPPWWWRRRAEGGGRGSE